MVVASGVTAVAAGSRHSLFLESDGSLWGMGDGTTTDRLTPEQILSSGVVAVAAGHGHSLFLKSDGSLWGMGENGFGQLGDGTYTSRPTPVTIVPPPPPTITSISLAGTNMVIVWPANQCGFTLQCASNLEPQVTWSNVSAGVVVSNQYVVTNSISVPRMFYRLAE
ncbi:MAG TPA: hypothetical protein VN578_09955 [Candidatus Binatia bacterium]|jgi:alpha-tubulin suppressor-like RCC1 family protein|nr:hypothetical protein [Candidatus Binatia bacterium]